MRPIAASRVFELLPIFVTDPAFFSAMKNSLILVGWVLGISVVFGTLLALLLDQAFYGRGFVRIMMIAPFLVMPTVSALVWQNMLMDPVSGFFATVFKGLGLTADRLVHPLSDDRSCHHGSLAMGSVCNAHPAHFAAVA